jgi:roadblock/LC7 domain-containing protein
MSRITVTSLLVGGAALAAFGTATVVNSVGATPAPAPTHSHSYGPATPNECILLNGGDYNACNVGHTGSGDQPYDVRKHHTPSDCILLNGGDYNACNVGNSGRGDKPYRPVHHSTGAKT